MTQHRTVVALALAAAWLLSTGQAHGQDDADTPLPASPPAAEIPALYAMAEAVSAARLRADVEAMIATGTRHTLSSPTDPQRGVGAARAYVASQFQEISTACGGCLEIMLIGGDVTGDRIPEPTDVVSVVAVQRGTIDPNRFVLMGGHLDSRASDVMDALSDAPGANDDASGVAGTIEAARILSQHQFAGSIAYAAFTGEEQGLFGARIVAEYAKENDWRIVGVLNNDMIGNIAGINQVIDNTTARVFSEGTRAIETPEEARLRRFTGGEVDSPSRNLARYVDAMADQYITNLDAKLVYRLDRFRRGGDHRPFNELGFPGVRIMETNEHYDRQHQDLRTEEGRVYGDTIDGVDFDYAAKLTALNVVALAGLAGAPPFPASVTVTGAVQPSTTLSWRRATGPEAENLAGYRVHWRETTDAEWRWSRWVGDVDTFTIENVVIDNYFFGVSAVAKDGAQTPVVFPGPAGAFEPWTPLDDE